MSVAELDPERCPHVVGIREHPDQPIETCGCLRPCPYHDGPADMLRLVDMTDDD